MPHELGLHLSDTVLVPTVFSKYSSPLGNSSVLALFIAFRFLIPVSQVDVVSSMYAIRSLSLEQEEDIKYTRFPKCVPIETSLATLQSVRLGNWILRTSSSSIGVRVAVFSLASSTLTSIHERQSSAREKARLLHFY